MSSSSLSAATENRPPRGEARKALLIATLEVIASHGLDAVTHRRVAEVAGVSPGSATYHFSSREDLIRAAFAYYMDLADRVIERLDAQIRSSSLDPAERVREILCGIVTEEFRDLRYVRAEYEMILYGSTDPELASFLRVWETRFMGYIAGDLEAAGALRAVETARILANLLRGYELERLTNPQLGVDDLRRRIDAVLTSLLP